jgi:hypothetical protein
MVVSPISEAAENVRELRFPGGFQPQLSKRLIERSPVVRSLLECAREDGDVELPEHLATLWLSCLSCSQAELDAADNSTITEYLTVRILWL